MSDIVDSISESVLADNHVLVSFDVVNMFPNIDNKLGLKSVKNVLLDNSFDLDSTQCIVDALEVCLTCNNSKFNHQNFLQKDDMAQGPQMFFSYANIAMAKCNSLANKFLLRPRIWKRLRDNIFVLWEHGIASLPLFLSYLNSVDKTGKINFTMEIASDTSLEFLDLKFKIVEGKIRVDVIAKPTNSFSYTTPSTYYPNKTYPTYLALGLEESVMMM